MLVRLSTASEPYDKEDAHRNPMNPTKLVIEFFSGELHTNSREVENEGKNTTQQACIEEFLGLGTVVVLG